MPTIEPAAPFTDIADLQLAVYIGAQVFTPEMLDENGANLLVAAIAARLRRSMPQVVGDARVIGADPERVLSCLESMRADEVVWLFDGICRFDRARVNGEIDPKPVPSADVLGWLGLLRLQVVADGYVVVVLSNWAAWTSHIPTIRASMASDDVERVQRRLIDIASAILAGDQTRCPDACHLAASIAAASDMNLFRVREIDGFTSKLEALELCDLRADFADGSLPLRLVAGVNAPSSTRRG
ncbi:hypothetical protein [Salinarimonas ramus]|uniref:Uncharacterized protein n=1 Tax=Salinarimonas ramus TaxID=690164 RepID=A0A917V6V8_9HYPH|nr:hypothetical protein [Salinarimonas ramus]GGK47226.1 hypothetical protein GCM10011322_37850 [Salinarimonas ramus]